MRLMLSVVCGVSLFLVVGCASETVGGGNDPESDRESDANPPSANGAKGACKLTLSGAQTGEYPCEAGGGFGKDANSSFVTISTSSSAPHGSFTMEFPGEAKVGNVAYASAIEGVFLWTRDFTAEARTTPTWSAEKSRNDPTKNRGDFTVTFSSVRSTGPTGGGNLYELHGTATATLPFEDESGATGTVTATLVF